MNWETNRPRRRASSRAGRPQEVKKDAVLSVMLAQIAICLVLLALAYSIKLTGLPMFDSARAKVGALLDEEADVTLLGEALGRWDLEVPVWLGRKGEAVPAGKTESEAETKPAQAPAVAAEPGAASSEPQAAGAAGPQEDYRLDEELSGLIQQYLPEGGADSAAGQTDTEGLELPDLSGEGQGGGINPVRMVSAGAKLSAPGGTTLSPFFLTSKPILPVGLGTLTCSFGYRTHPITGKEDFHTGVDIAAAAGDPISAVLAGTVSEVGQSPYYGNFIVVRHSSGLETAYCHCSEILAPVGAVVRQREVIARVGSTGMSTGSHVHLEFRVNGQQANPSWVYSEF